MKLILPACLLLASALAGCDVEPIVSEEVVAPETMAEKLTSSVATKVIETVSADGVTIYGEPYYGGLDRSAPLVLLFHQGGSNGRAEYAPLGAWLNSLGFRAIAWDQRTGGQRYGRWNRTRADLPDVPEPGYCDAYPDLQAALDYVIDQQLADEVLVWGSSYSGALVFRLAAENPERVTALLSFSPASGGPMEDCLAKMWVDSVNAPMLVVSPDSEMDRESSQEQFMVLTSAGVDYEVIDNGIHGSSMLLDKRTGHDMSAARNTIATWLQSVTP
ncbi:MAG: alpha/beta fold hydrolase [Gammaproteobacteria bacterium]|nr:alpha/beta fold hydrolase [Gammaproteobacteria bacterium]